MVGFERNNSYVFSFIFAGILTSVLLIPLRNSLAATKKTSLCGNSEAINAFLALSKDSQDDAKEMSAKLQKEFKINNNSLGDLSKTTVTDTLKAMNFGDVSAFPANLKEALIFRGNQLVRDETKKISNEPNAPVSDKNKSRGSTRELALSELQRKLSLLFSKGRTNIIALRRSSNSPKIITESEKALLQFSQAEAKIWGTFVELSAKTCIEPDNSKPSHKGGAR